MTLAEVWHTYNDYTATVSNITRQLSFAGLAVVWLFKAENVGQYRLDRALIAPSIALVLALALDLAQYIAGTLVFLAVGTLRESKYLLNDVDYESWVIAPIDFFFVLKLIAVATAYSLLLRFLYTRLVKSP